MKTLSFEKMETIEGGFNWSWSGCLTGATIDSGMIAYGFVFGGMAGALGVAAVGCAIGGLAG